MSLIALTSGNLTQSPEPVIVLLHGYGSDERDLAGLAPHLPDLAWASVRAPLSHPAWGYAWYPLNQLDVLAPAGEAIATATDALWEWIDASINPTSPLIVVGFSQGGCMATQLLRTRPDRIAGTAILSGYAQALPQPADDVLATLRPAVFWGRGDADPVIPARAIADTREWVDSHTRAQIQVYPRLGHSVNDAELQDLDAWIRGLAVASAGP